MANAKIYTDGVEVNEVLSTIGNAYFSNLTFEELWSCVFLSETREELDAAVSSTIDLKELVECAKLNRT